MKAIVVVLCCVCAGGVFGQGIIWSTISMPPSVEVGKRIEMKNAVFQVSCMYWQCRYYYGQRFTREGYGETFADVKAFLPLCEAYVVWSQRMKFGWGNALTVTVVLPKDEVLLMMFSDSEGERMSVNDEKGTDSFMKWFRELVRFEG